MTTLLILCIPITSLLMGFFVLKSVQIGLRWQMDIKQDRPPTLENPLQPIITPIVEARQEKAQQKATEMQQTVYDEWVNGAKEG